MNKKFEKIIERIAIIKINIMFIIVFSGASMYIAEKIQNVESLKELFFWISILLIITFQIIKPISRIFNKIQEFVILK